jgi:hypothetical protein
MWIDIGVRIFSFQYCCWDVHKYMCLDFHFHIPEIVICVCTSFYQCFPVIETFHQEKSHLQKRNIILFIFILHTQVHYIERRYKCGESERNSAELIRVFGWRAAGAERRLRSRCCLDGQRRERSGSRGNIPLICGLALSLRIRGMELLRSCSCSAVSLLFPRLSLVLASEARDSG